jgi:hypothetical protein
MEHLPPRSFIQNDHPLSLNDPGYIASRRAMGQTRRFATRMNLAKMTPHNDLASSTFCLANPSAEYLVYQPAGATTLSVKLPAGRYTFEWFDAIKASIAPSGIIEAAARETAFKPPFDNEGVLYLKATQLQP